MKFFTVGLVLAFAAFVYAAPPPDAAAPAPPAPPAVPAAPAPAAPPAAPAPAAAPATKPESAPGIFFNFKSNIFMA